MAKQLLDPRDQLPNYRSVRLLGTVFLVCGMVVPGLERERCSYLELVYYRQDLGSGVPSGTVTSIEVLEGIGRIVPKLALIVYDQDSRNASIVAARRRFGDTDMAATTPSEAGLLDGYDRTAWRGEEQIRCGMLLSIPEARDKWYERRRGRL